MTLNYNLDDLDMPNWSSSGKSTTIEINIDGKIFFGKIRVLWLFCMIFQMNKRIRRQASDLDKGRKVQPIEIQSRFLRLV